MGEVADPSSLEWSRALIKDLAEGWAVRVVQESHHVEVTAVGEAEPDVTGLVALDGSLIGKYRGGGALGWGIAAATDEGTPLVRHHGLVPVDLPVQRRILRAELWSLLALLRLMVPPVRAVTDNSTIIRGLAMGEQWCTAPTRAHADVWRLVWFQLNDVGLGLAGIDVEKVKAHLSARRISQLPQEERPKYLANQAADTAAKQGASLDVMELARGQTMAEAGARVTGILKYWAELLPQIRNGNGWLDADTIPASLPREKAQRVQYNHFPRHDVGTLRPPTVQCSRCGKMASTTAAKLRLAMEPCFGHAVARLQMDPCQRWAISNSHLLMRTGQIVWCCRCGCYAQRKLRLMKAPCRGVAKNAGQRYRWGRLERGCHPVTGAFISDAVRVRYQDSSIAGLCLASGTAM